MENMFSQWKKQRLKRLDLSKKGSVDEEIVHVVSLLNSCEEFFSTSSCSGRIILIDTAPESSGVQKQNCVWLFVSHQKCSSDDLISGLARSTGDAVLKFEPFVLHVQCRRLEDAQLMHSVAVNSGFRNSGLTVGKTGKIIAVRPLANLNGRTTFLTELHSGAIFIMHQAVRSTHSLEVPLSHQGRLLVGHEYINFLIQVANQKMEENIKQIQRFYQNLQSALFQEKLQIPDTPNALELQNQASPHMLKMVEAEEGEDRDKTSVYKRRRRRGQQQQTDCDIDDRDSSPPELDDCLDLFT